MYPKKNLDYNSTDLDPDQFSAYLVLGLRTPQNDYKRKLAVEIKEIEDDGYEIEIPFNNV